LKLRLGLGLLLLAGAVYFAVFGGDYDSFDLRRIRSERAAEEQRVQEAEAEVQRLRARRDSLLHDSGAIERVARERYGLIREGERLYRFADSPDAVADSAAGAAGAGQGAGAVGQGAGAAGQGAGAAGQGPGRSAPARPPVPPTPRD
jgi:cell division protein FtsB